jgi:hypothetical protein
MRYVHDDYDDETWRAEAQARLDAKVDRSAGPEACWPFRGATSYGSVTLRLRTWGAHRLAFIIAGHTLGDTEMVRHKCDNPPCCNPAHLLRGTAVDNSADARERGRTKRGPRT